MNTNIQSKDLIEDVLLDLGNNITFFGELPIYFYSNGKFPPDAYCIYEDKEYFIRYDKRNNYWYHLS